MVDCCFRSNFGEITLRQIVMGKHIWKEIEELYEEFQKLGVSQSVDYEKYYLYSLITHSTAIEGSNLSITIVLTHPLTLYSIPEYVRLTG